MVLAVIYVTATVMSSLSVFACDHDHLHHTFTEERCSTSHCHCCSHSTNDSGEAYTCDHHHDLLSDNLTEYVTSSERSTLRSDDISAHITDYATVEAASVDLSAATIDITARTGGYEVAPPRAAVITHDSLRAPPHRA